MPLAYIAPAVSQWCANRQAILFACEKCGRWLEPERRRCPGCSARVLPVLPSHTGRRSDQQGFQQDWRWYTAWDELQTPFEEQTWTTEGKINACIAAHGYMYVWEDANLIRLDPAFGYAQRFPHRRERVDFSGTESLGEISLPLGQTIQPAVNLDWTDRIAGIGSAAMLAARSGFVWVNLCRFNQANLLLAGEPIAQAGDSVWWIGWIRQQGTPCLYIASAQNSHNGLLPKPVSVPESAYPRDGSRVAISENVALWLAQDGTLWRLDCLEAVRGSADNSATALPKTERVVAFWVEDGRAQYIQEKAGSAMLYATEANGETAHVPLQQANGSVQRACVNQEWIITVRGQNIYMQDRSDMRAPYDRKLASCQAAMLVPTAENVREVRLLMLYQTSEGGRLDMLNPISGAAAIVWPITEFDQTLKAVALLPIGDSLYIVHNRGVARLKEASR